MLGRTLFIFIATIALAFILVAGCEGTFQVSLEAEPEEGGEVTGEGEYSSETKITIEAQPGEGYFFKEWQEDGKTVSREKSYTFAVEEDRDLVALFEEETVEVSLYFGCQEAIQTGETGEYGYLTPVSREIIDPQDPEGLLQATLEMLIQGPTAKEEEKKEVSPVVHDTLEVLSVEIECGVATVNVCQEMFGENWSGGTLGGSVFIDSFVYTVIQFTEVDKLLVQVEGENWQDGHFYWDEPWSPEKTVEE